LILCSVMTASCALIVNHDLDGLEPYPADTGAPDGRTGDADASADVRDADAGADDARDADAGTNELPDAPLDGSDAGDTGAVPTPDGGDAGILVTGGFVASSVAPVATSQYQIVGRMVSAPPVRGTTKSGLIIEGWLQ
jgi:hypothetical protein